MRPDSAGMAAWLTPNRPTLFAALALASATALAQQPARQDLNQLKLTVEQFLQSQVAGMAGQVSVAVGPIDQRMSLASCPQPQAFFMPGARAWGKTTVGVRCASPSAWTVYIQANVSVQADYVASAVPLAQGQPIEATQLAMVRGDLTTLPAGVATDVGQVIGRSSNVSLAAGTPLRLDTLRSKPVVQSGQLVKLVSGNASFRVSSEARAVATASEGQMVAVRTANGSQVTGIARAGGLVEVAF
ncbi:flagellar basal body P-ring formation chaperone FlgA [Pseudoduganella rivuli]|nr:flagellar basal body P-ring formation chaperone FlgA [Pseudoduganella rivuli]